MVPKLLVVNGGGYTSILNVRSVQSLGLWTQQCSLLYTTLQTTLSNIYYTVMIIFMLKISIHRMQETEVSDWPGILLNETRKVETYSTYYPWQVYVFYSKITAFIVLTLFNSPVLQDYIHLLQGEQQVPGSKHVAPVHFDSALTAPHTPSTCMKIITITSFLSTNHNIIYFTIKLRQDSVNSTHYRKTLHFPSNY